MSIVLIAPQPDDIRSLLPWTICLGRSRQEQISVVLPQRKKGELRFVEVTGATKSDESDLVTLTLEVISESSRLLARRIAEPDEAGQVRSTQPEDAEKSSTDFEVPEPQLYQLLGTDWTKGIAEHVRSLKPSLLVLPAPVISKDHKAEADWQVSLMNNVDCEVMLLRDDAVTFDDSLHVAAILFDDCDNETALRTSVQLAREYNGVVTAVFVQPPVGDLSFTVGRRQLDDLLRRTVRRDDLQDFRHKVIVQRRPADAFQKLDMSDFDMVVFATSHLREMQRFLNTSPASPDADSVPAVAIVREAASFGNQILNKIDRYIRSFVPQLSREDRVGLVGRIQNSSQWDFDFVLLTSLATFIACLGLAEDSGSVIVGAMLVAPLMTPIAGIGLGVAHANSYLSSIALRTSLRGFATAMAIGVLFGLCVQMIAATGWLQPLLRDSAFPAEMENRMRPQFYDLLIALASGIAAAYAMGRPTLFSALPGVAIAAALVPPIATSGIALSHGQLTKGGGALLLFVTNMVTIILGASLVFRAVGIRAQKDGQQAVRWPRYALLLLVVLSVLVTVIIEIHRSSRQIAPPN